jgi:hypothetical protein
LTRRIATSNAKRRLKLVEAPLGVEYRCFAVIIVLSR